MTKTPPQTLMDRLDGVLDQERVALLSGNLEDIARLSGAKNRLIEELNSADPQTRARLQPLQDKVARNQVLLDGALQGIRKVASRLAALSKIRRSLDTYDAKGRRQTIPGEIAHQMEKRA